MKPAEYNDDELKNLAPKLSSMEKRESFSIPGNYFDSLPDQIMDKISTSSQLEESAVTNPFTVPPGYFEGLPLDIINRIEAMKSKKISLAALLTRALRPKYSLSLVAACFVVLLCFRFFEKPINVNVAQANSTETQSISPSESYVLGEVDENTLMNVVVEESASIIKPVNSKNAGDKTIEDYIINNNIDVSDVAKEL